MPGQRQGEGTLGLVAGQSCGRIQHTLQGGPRGQIVGLVGGQLTSEAFELRTIRQGVVQHDEELFQLHRNLDNGGEHHQERPLLLAGHQVAEDGLDHFGTLQEAVVVMQQQQRGAGAVRQGRQGSQDSQRIALGHVRGRGLGSQRKPQAASHVPGGQLPLLLPGELGDLPFGLVGLVRLDPQPGEGRMNIVRQLLGQGHRSEVLSPEEPKKRQPPRRQQATAGVPQRRLRLTAGATARWQHVGRTPPSCARR